MTTPMMLWSMIPRLPSRPSKNRSLHTLFKLPWLTTTPELTRTKKSLEIAKGAVTFKGNNLLGLAEHYFLGLIWLIIRSISVMAGPEALVRRSSRVFTSRALRASSPAFTIIPHFTHISILSSVGRLVHFGMNSEASFVFPAPNISL